MLLTHLDPGYFNHFCFSKHKLQVRYLAKKQDIAPSVFLKLVQHREAASIKDFVGRHYFHYHPEEKDLETEFQTLQIKRSWGNSHYFYQLINEELNKYLKSDSYDSIAVLLAIRIKIERIAYEQIKSESQRTKFIETHGTRNKLDFCESECGLQIPETHYLLGIVYNNDLHYKNGRDYETPLRSKLDNVTIKKIIKDIAEKQTDSSDLLESI